MNHENFMGGAIRDDVAVVATAVDGIRGVVHLRDKERRLRLALTRTVTRGAELAVKRLPIQ